LTRIIADWLPPSTFIDPRVHGLLTDHVKRWSDRWFGGRISYMAGELELVKPVRRANVASSISSAIAHGFACNWTPRQAIDFAKQLIDAQQPRHQNAGKDDALLLSLADAALSDLVAAIARSAGFADDSIFDAAALETYGGVKFALTTAKKNQVHFKLVLDSHHAAFLRKSVMVPTAHLELPDARLADSFDAEPIEVAAHVGQASLSAQSLWGLAAGDVILLDRRVDDSFPMVASSNGEQICQLNLSQQETENRLVVAEG
jgi:hypothetical protein